MAITVSIELNRDLEIPASYDEVFDLLADVPKSVEAERISQNPQTTIRNNVFLEGMRLHF